MGGLHGRGGRGCGGIPCHHENLGPLGVPGSRMPVQPPGARTSGSLPRARPNLGLHAYLRLAHALQLYIEYSCKGDNMSSLSTGVYCTAVLCVTSTREAYRLLVIVGFKCQAVRPFTLGRPAPEGRGYRRSASARTCRAPVNTPQTTYTCKHAMHSSLLARARAWLSRKLAARAPAPAAFDA